MIDRTSPYKAFPEECRYAWSARIELGVGDRLPLCPVHAPQGEVVRSSAGWVGTRAGRPRNRLLRWLNWLLEPTEPFVVTVMNCPHCPDLQSIITRAPGWPPNGPAAAPDTGEIE